MGMAELQNLAARSSCSTFVNGGGNSTTAALVVVVVAVVESLFSYSSLFVDDDNDDDASGVAVVASDLVMNIDDRLADVTAERVEEEENACDGTNDIALGNCTVSTSAKAKDDSFIVYILPQSMEICC